MTTDTGLTGIGESGAFGALEASAAQINNFASFLVGKDPLDIEHLWQAMFRGFFFRGSAVMGAISAIDVALWDIAGKYYGVPIYKLLGGKCRDKVRVYAHVFAKNDESWLQTAKTQRRRVYGLSATCLRSWMNLHLFRMKKPMLPILRVHQTCASGAVKLVGDNVDLCIELHRRSLPGEATVLINEIEDVHPLFVEDPIPPGNNDAMASVVAKSKIPVATGERLHTIFEFQDLLDKKATDYVRVSLSTVGGITGARKIAALAETKMCPIVPHNPCRLYVLQQKCSSA